MNHTGTSCYTLFLKTFQKQLLVSKAHAFTKRNFFQLNKPRIVNQGCHESEGSKQQSYKLAVSGYSNYTTTFSCFSPSNVVRVGMLSAGFHTTSGNW